jgi:hypothetical protein
MLGPLDGHVRRGSRGFTKLPFLPGGSAGNICGMSENFLKNGQ